MAILQISKIQQRSGNIVDLPQLDDAEFGWASDAKRLFIGKTTPNENIEILTAYSKIDFSQINGAVGNLNISNVSIENGQVLAFDGENWVNKGGIAGGLITLGDVSNVKLAGGAIGYVLETDGTGNLSWTPKSTIVAYIKNITLSDSDPITNPNGYTIITTTSDSAFGQGAAVTITGVIGPSDELNGKTYYISYLQSANEFALYVDAELTVPLDSTGWPEFPYTAVTATTESNRQITVEDATNFTIGDPVVFSGDLGDSTLVAGRVYYVKNKDTSGPDYTWIIVSEAPGGEEFIPNEATGLNAVVYASGGRLVSSVNSGSGGSATFPGGSNSSIQFNRTSTFAGSSDLTYNDTTKQFTVNGNAAVGNISADGVIAAKIFINTDANTAPFTVASNIRVPNLNVAYSNVSDFGVVTNQTTGTFYPVLVNNSSSGNRALGTSANISFNADTGNLSVALLNVTSNANIGNLGILGLATVTGNITGGNIFANSGTIGASKLTGSLTTAAQPNITSVGTLTSLSVTGNIAAGNLSASNVSFTGSEILLGDIDAVQITGGTSGYVLITDGTGNLSFTDPGAVGTQPAGANTQVQYNDTGALGASSAFTFNETSNVLTVSGGVTSSRLTSTVATGTPPLQVNSTTQVANLNAATAGTVTNNAQPNITSLGTLASLLVSGTANATAVNATTGAFTNVSGSGSGLTNLPGANVTGKVANAVYADNAGSVSSVPWTGVTGRPTNVSQFNNDAGYITAAQVGGFAPGTRMLFAQTNAPTGWTKDTSATLNDAALRIVTGSAGSGGTVNFSAAFTNKTVTGSINATTAEGTVGTTSVAGQVGSASIIGSIETTAVSGTIGATPVDGTIGPTSTTGTVADATISGSISTSATGIQIYPSYVYLENEQRQQYAVNGVTLSDPGHSHSFSTGPHTHGFTGSSHSHPFSSPAHSHSFSSPSHGHGFTNQPHSHSFSSPGHSHSFAGSSHSHEFNGSSINLAVKYVDVIIATKD